MPAKKQQTVAQALNDLMGKYQLTPFSLARQIKMSYTSVRNLAIGVANLSVPVALRLAKVFGNTPQFWLDLQHSADLAIALNDKNLTKILTSISKAQMPSATARTTATGKPKSAGKRNTLAEKRKTAAKVPGTRGSRGR